MDGPVFASGKSKFRCGRVQPCVRPRPAAHMWPRALMKSADWIPITSMRTKRLARKGCPNPRFDRCVINTQSSCKPLREDMPPMWIGITQPPLRRIASGSGAPSGIATFAPRDLRDRSLSTSARISSAVVLCPCRSRMRSRDESYNIFLISAAQ